MDETKTPAWMNPVQPWSFSGPSATTSPSEDSAGETGAPDPTSGSVDQREAAIAVWLQAVVALVPAAITLLVSFGFTMSNEQQLAATGFAGALGTMGLLTWKTFRKRRATR